MMQSFGRFAARTIITKHLLTGGSSYLRFGVLAGLHHQSAAREPFQSPNALSKLKEPVNFFSEIQNDIRSIKSAHQPPNSRNLLVELGDGQRYEFPLVWLRDNCQCPKCFHPKAHSRIIDWERFNPDSVAIQNCSVTDDGAQVDITWHDGHKSHFNSTWLENRNFTEQNAQKFLKTCYKPKQQLWKKEEFGEIMKNFEFEDVMNKDEALQEWIEALSRYGVVMIRNAPLNKQESLKLANRIGRPKRTHYGEQFVFKYLEDSANEAYMNSLIQMHTDLSSLQYKPGVNLLHCMVQAGSNEERNTLVDAFSVADHMRREYPENFRVLTEVPVNWSDVGSNEDGKFHNIHRAPVICLDREGNLERINHSVPQRDSVFSVPLDRVEPWYRAMACFVGLLRQQAVEFKTWQGDMLTFNNLRMVHGRSGYEDAEDNTKNLVGLYMDWDEIYSRLRLLKKEGEKKIGKIV